MTRTYCPRFEVVIALLLLILFSVGMIMHALWTLSTISPSSISPMTYFFILAFVAVAVLSTLIIVHMLFPKRVLIPPPCQ